MDLGFKGNFNYLVNMAGNSLDNANVLIQIKGVDTAFQTIAPGLQLFWVSND